MNSEPQSKIMWLEISCLEKTCIIKISTRLADITALVVGMNIDCLVKQSIMMRMAL